MSWHRDEGQLSFSGLAPRPSFRRVSCRCGCRGWFYAPRTPGRPPAYANRDHALRARRARRRSYQ